MDHPGKLRLDLFDAYGDPLHEKVDVYLYHQTFSEVVAVREVMASKKFTIGKLRQSPQGLYRLSVDPPSYLPVSVFVNIASSGVTERALYFPVDKAKVIRVQFPSYGDLADAHNLLVASSNVLGFERKSGEALYDALDDVRRAGFLNIIAKCRRTPLAGGGVVLNSIRELREIRGDRFFAVVPHELREQVENSVSSELFRPVDGSLHRPPEGYSRAGSYKTLDSYGNLQLTFFASSADWVADIDIDDAAGLAHVFQVARNRLTGRPTHPYEIHDILLRHQEIDAGYRLIVREEPAVRTQAAGRKA